MFLLPPPFSVTDPTMSKQQPQKRGMTLDFNSTPSSKKTCLATGNVNVAGGLVPPVLTTPDVQMLKLSSPELAKFLSGNNGLPTPTPSGYAFPKTVTEEQELYAKGFEDALKKMHSKGTTAATTTVTVASASRHPPAATETAISTIEKATAAHAQKSVGVANDSNLIMAASAIAEQPPLPVSVPSRPSSSASGSVDDSSDGYNFPDAVRVKEELTDSDESGVGAGAGKGGARACVPINMEAQEQIKLERKRMRNRIAATKCRKRKLERISQLDGKVEQLKGENVELAQVVKKLKEAVCNLKQEVMDHMNSGCQIMVTDINAL